MNRIGFGRTAEVYELDESKIVKLFYTSVPDEIVKREYDITSLVVSKISNVPKIYDLVKQDNRYGIVFQKIDGMHMGQYMSLHPNRISKVIHEFALLHQKINDTTLDTDKIKTKDISDIIAVIEKRYCCEQAEKKLIIEYLKVTDHKNLCHGDYHPENVLIDSNLNLWVIDWATLVICNKMFDIARTYYILRYGKSPEKKPIHIRMLEKYVCVFLSKRYLEKRVTTKKEKETFSCYLYINLILRQFDDIKEEKGMIVKLLKKMRKMVLKTMEYEVTQKSRRALRAEEIK